MAVRGGITCCYGGRVNSVQYSMWSAWAIWVRAADSTPHVGGSIPATEKLSHTEDQRNIISVASTRVQYSTSHKACRGTKADTELLRIFPGILPQFDFAVIHLREILNGKYAAEVGAFSARRDEKVINFTSLSWRQLLFVNLWHFGQ